MGVVVLVGVFISRDHHFRTRRTKFGHSAYFHWNPTIFNFYTAPPLFWTYRQTDSTFAGTRHPWWIRAMNSPSSMDFSIAASTRCCLEWWICCACFIQNNSIVGFEAMVVNGFALSCDHYYETPRAQSYVKMCNRNVLIMVVVLPSNFSSAREGKAGMITCLENSWFSCSWFCMLNTFAVAS